MALLTADDVRKSYGARAVLDGTTLEVERGEVVAIVGLSGAGKSTLLSILAGLVRPDSGRVTMNGAPVDGPSPTRGVVFQGYSLLPWATVSGNVRLAVDSVHHAWSAKAREEHVAKYVAMVGLAQAADKRPRELSGGMRQRVAVARALAMEPEVLLMDEPFGALDALTRRTLQDELSRIQRETARTIVLVTNDVDEALILSDRVVSLAGGRLGESVDGFARAEDPRAESRSADFARARRDVVESVLGRSLRRTPATSETVLSYVDPEEACA